MSIYVNNTGGDSADLSALTKVKRVRKWNAAGNRWVEIEEVWESVGGGADESAMRLIHRTILLDIETNQEDYDLFVAAGSPTDPVTVVCNVAAGVTIGGTLSTGYAFDTGTGWHADARLEVNNSGSILGAAGDGGNSSVCTGLSISASVAGGNGGAAINMQHDLHLNNSASGIIGGGGGGGGGGGAQTFIFSGSQYGQCSGGSGGGAGYNAGGAAGDKGTSTGNSYNRDGYDGEHGTALTGGAGGFGWVGYSSPYVNGGNGGNIGSAGFGGGSPGPSAVGTSKTDTAGSSGGDAGRAVTLTAGTLHLVNDGTIGGAYA